MDKSAIFDEFKKNQELKEKEVEKETVEKELTKKTENDEKKQESTSNKKEFKKNKRKRTKKAKNKKEALISETDYEMWKEKFLSDKTNAEFMELLNFHRERNCEMFTNEEFLKIKYKHPSSRELILDPTLNEINMGKGGNFYIIKGLSIYEYNNFIKTVGPRDENPEEFMEYAIKTGVLYPKMTDIKIMELGAGTILTLYKYVMEFSDLTKTIRVFEV